MGKWLKAPSTIAYHHCRSWIEPLERHFRESSPAQHLPGSRWPRTGAACHTTLRSLTLCFPSFEHACDSYDQSLTHMSGDVVCFWHPLLAFSHWTLSPFIVDLVEYHCAETFTMTSRARLFGDDTRLSAIFTSDGPREKNASDFRCVTFTSRYSKTNAKPLSSQATLHQKEDMRIALENTNARCIAKANPHDKLWGIVWIPMIRVSPPVLHGVGSTYQVRR